jgi:two-component system, NtrC family, sensor kinase
MRLLLTTNLLVAGVAIAVGWLAYGVAAREIESKLVTESLTQAATSFQEGHLPRTDASLLRRMGQILGGETAVGPATGRGVAASSLDTEQQMELSRQLHGVPVPTRVTLRGTAYRVGATVLAPAAPGTEAMLLYLLVPEARITAARSDVARAIAIPTLVAVALATLATVWLAHSITRPVRRLAARMERLSQAARDVNLDALLAADTREGSSAPGGVPREIARLTTCYDHLLEQLASARATLARSARMATLGQLSASVAHELRNPLSGIKMNARVLADEMVRAGLGDESTRIIIREVDRMDTYLAQLLGLATRHGHADASADDGPPLELTEMRVDAIVDSVVPLVEARCRRMKIAIDRRDSEAPPVRADVAKVRQVVLNLLLNAADAMPRGGTLHIDARATDDSGVRVSVRDSGDGVRVPDGADVFEPFVSGKADGTGLGLYICRQIVEQHGGEIGYDVSAEGTTFWFTLPGGRG